MKIPAISRSAVLAGFMLAAAISLGVEPAAGFASFEQHAPDSARTLRAAQNAAYHRGGTIRRFYEQERRIPPRSNESRHQLLLRFLDLAAERRELAIEALDRYALELPGDDWIVGHRVGLRIMQGQTAEAAAIAGECQASKWWCDALRGFTHHVEGRIVEADQAFASALSGMPEDVHCFWLEELLPILDGELRREYVNADCTRRIGLGSRIWWLADPLHIRAGNDRRTEQMSRVVAMRLHHESLAIEEGGPCAEEHHTLHLRIGWGPWWWELTPLGQRVDDHWDSRGFRFLPTDGAWQRPEDSSEHDWRPVLVETGERHRPTFGSMAPLDQQTAFFARADSLLVLAAAEPGSPVSVAGLALSRNEHEVPAIAHDTDVTGTVRFRMRVPRDAWLVSVEAIGPRGAFRSRFGHRLVDPSPGGLALSDLLLFDWQEGLDQSLAAVSPRMIGTTVLAPDRDVGIFWEVYGATDRSRLEVSLSVLQIDRGLFRRLGQALGLVSSPSPVSVDWTDTNESDGILGNHLRVDVSEFGSGRYELELTVRDGSGDPAITKRTFEIRG